MQNPRNIIGPIIRKLRQDNGLTQSTLVAKLNLIGWDISRETLAKIETQIRWVADTEVILLAEALKVDPGELLKKAKSHSVKSRI